MDTVDTELKDLNICDQLRANSSFMKVMATLFHYGNQSMNAAQLVIAVRALNLLPLRGETPKSTIQGIISTSRKAARDLRQPDPFQIDKDNSGRQAKYSIAENVLNGATVPAVQEIPDEPIILKPVEHSTPYASSYSGGGQLGKRQRKTPKFYTPDALRKAKNRRARSKLKRSKGYDGDSDSASDIDVDMDDDSLMSMGSSDDDDQTSAVPEEDTISGYSLVYAPPSNDNTDYIDPINFEDYPIAAYFAVAQQKGYSYPRFRSHEKVKIPKINCEDKFRVADIVSESTQHVVGRMFILADGHGGRGCSEFFVRNTPAAVQKLCANYDPAKFDDKQVQKSFEAGIKKMVEVLDEEYLKLKRIQLGRGARRNNNNNSSNNNNNVTTSTTTTSLSPSSAEKNGNETEISATNDVNNNTTTTPENSEELDNDGCTLIINMFFGNWLININVGDSRSVLISAPDPGVPQQKTAEELNNFPLMCGLDNDYKMDVVFASQDHKPYLEHLAREILENGGEFIDSVQDRVIKVDLDKLREDGNRQAKRVALKNARIRPKRYHSNNDNNNGHADSPNDNNNSNDATQGYAAQSAVRTTANHFNNKPYHHHHRSREDRVPSLNVARSCGDLDFKMSPERKIISCEPDVSFFRISDDINPLPSRTVVTSNMRETKKQRHFLFMGTDGMFDYMYEETPERQNRAVAKVLGPMIEDGEKVGALMLDEEEKLGGQTIEHNPDNKENDVAPMTVDSETTTNDKATTSSTATPETAPAAATQSLDNNTNKDTTQTGTEVAKDAENEESQQVKKDNQEPNDVGMKNTDDNGEEGKKDQEEKKEEEEKPPKPRLFRELDDENTRERKIRERTLVMAARYFANRESVHGFFSSTLQDYDDCTIVLIEI
ncbi:hypothetical protein BDA99DRAFT_558871 [Phascolomyces articulosus]|uniref:protein-serine/threonine phosphatase n=1 Tax=Phascolomyces articulosus TaxID=60185 RepID=A0AAD5K3C7_9FUNG|nr:hypothetical protein BDA99DRAFT_558871 [Phascolomyces articulosus]